MDKAFEIIWILGFGFGALMCISISIYMKIKTDKLIKSCTNSCSGTLVDIIEKRHMESNGDFTYNRIYYYPIYEYEVKNKKYRIGGTSRYQFKKTIYTREKVEIKYNPEKPEEAYPKESFSKVWVVFLGAGIFCLIDLVIGIAVRRIFNF